MSYSKLNAVYEPSFFSKLILNQAVMGQMVSITEAASQGRKCV